MRPLHVKCVATTVCHHRGGKTEVSCLGSTSDCLLDVVWDLSACSRCFASLRLTSRWDLALHKAEVKFIVVVFCRGCGYFCLVGALDARRLLLAWLGRKSGQLHRYRRRGFPPMD